MLRYRLRWPIIGLTGAAGCGKDTAANLIASYMAIHRFALATPIKRAINAMFDLASVAWDDRQWKEADQEIFGGRSPRFLAQTLGTEWGREMVSQDIWIRILEQRIELSRFRDNWPIVVTDIRFPNEARWIRDQGGVVVLIVRGGVPLISGKHQSEQHQLEPEVRLDNGGSLDHLKAEVREKLLTTEES